MHLRRSLSLMPFFSLHTELRSFVQELSQFLFASNQGRICRHSQEWCNQQQNIFIAKQLFQQYSWKGTPCHLLLKLIILLMIFTIRVRISRPQKTQICKFGQFLDPNYPFHLFSHHYYVQRNNKRKTKMKYHFFKNKLHNVAISVYDGGRELHSKDPGFPSLLSRCW